MHIGVVSNPISGGGRAKQVAGTLAARLAQRGHAVREIDSSPGPASRWLDDHLGDLEAVAVVGGDGTVRSVARSLARARVPMVHVPQGNENLLARATGMRGPLSHSIALLEDGVTRDIDLAQANGEDMVLMASMGFDAVVVDHVARHRRHSVSHRNYIKACLAAWPRWRPPTLTITVDGRLVVDRLQGWVVVANAPNYAWRLNPASVAQLNDGCLDVAFLPMRSNMALVPWMLRCRFGVQHRHAGYVHTRGHQVRVEADPAQPWQIDGDPPGSSGPTEVLEVAVDTLKLPVRIEPGAPLRAISGD